MLQYYLFDIQKVEKAPNPTVPDNFSAETVIFPETSILAELFLITSKPATAHKLSKSCFDAKDVRNEYFSSN